MSDDELSAIHRDLAKDNLYIDPSLAGQFTPDQRTSIKEQIAKAENPVFVVAYPFSPSDDYSGNAADLLTRLHAAYPEPGLYLATTKQLTVGKYANIRLEGKQWGLPGEGDGDLTNYDLLTTIHYEEPSSLGAAFDRVTELLLLDPEQASKANEKARKEWYAENDMTDSSTGRDENNPDGGGVDPTGLIVAGLVVAVLGTALWGFLRRRRTSRGAPHALPASAMARIRQAHDRQLERQARNDVLGLGEAIDAAEITERGNTGAWQAALDHYEAARRTLRDDAPDVLDVVGAIVLADNGRAALASALDGRDFIAPSRCFLNPLHERAVDTRTVEYGTRQVEVPLCDACRTALSRNKSPDILDVVRRGKPVHYFETDAEPWASTGYGSLEADLLGRLHSGR